MTGNRRDFVPPGYTYGQCGPCEKGMYRSRSSAKKAAARVPGSTMSAYPCPHNEQAWHIGHLPRDVRNGTLDRREYARKATRNARRRG